MDAAIISYLESIGPGYTAHALAISKACGCQTKKEINPVLYNLQRQSRISKVSDSPPLWRLNAAPAAPAIVDTGPPHSQPLVARSGLDSASPRGLGRGIGIGRGMNRSAVTAMSLDDTSTGTTADTQHCSGSGGKASAPAVCKSQLWSLYQRVASEQAAAAAAGAEESGVSGVSVGSAGEATCQVSYLEAKQAARQYHAVKTSLYHYLHTAANLGYWVQKPGEVDAFH